MTHVESNMMAMFSFVGCKHAGRQPECLQAANRSELVRSALRNENIKQNRALHDYRVGDTHVED